MFCPHLAAGPATSPELLRVELKPLEQLGQRLEAALGHDVPFRANLYDDLPHAEKYQTITMTVRNIQYVGSFVSNKTTGA